MKRVKPLPLKKQIKVLKCARRKVLEINLHNSLNNRTESVYLCNVLARILPGKVDRFNIHEYIPLFNNANARIWANGIIGSSWFNSNSDRLRFLETLINRLEFVQAQRRLRFNRKLWIAAYVAAFVVGIILGKIVKQYYL